VATIAELTVLVQIDARSAMQGAQQVNRALASIGTATNQLQQNMRAAGGALNTARSVQSARQLNSSLNQVRTTAGQMKATQVRVNAGPARTALSGLRGSMRSTSETATRTAARVTGAFAGVMAGLVANSVMMVAEFDRSQAAVRAFTGATAQEMQGLEKAARDAAKGTSFTATEASNALIELGKTGFSATEAIQGLPPVLQLATAGQLQMAKAADISSTIMNTFGLSAKDLGGVTDALAAAATNSATNVEKLGFTFARMSAAANAAGHTVEEAAEAAALMAEAGFRGTAAGTGLNTVYLQLNAEAGKGKKLFESYGVELRKADGSMRRLSDITLDAQKAGISYNEIIEAFGLNHGPKFAAILGLTEGKINAVKNATLDTTGAGAEMARIMENNLAGAFKRLGSAWQEFQLVLLKDTGIDSFLSRLVDGLARLINVVNGLGSKHPMLVKIAAGFVLFLGLTAGVTAMILALKLLVVQLGLVGIIMTGALFTAVGALLLLFGAFAAALVVTWKSSESFRSKVSSAFDAVKATARNLWQVLTTLWGAVRRGVELWRAATGATDAFGQSLSSSGETVGQTLGVLGEFGQAIGRTISGLGNLTKVSDDLTAAVARTLIAFSEQGLLGALRTAQAEFGRLGPAILGIVKAAFAPLVAWIRANGPRIVSALLELREAMQAAALVLFTTIVEALPRIVPPLIAGLVRMLVSTVQFLVQAVPLLVQAALTLFTGILTGFAQALPQLIAFVAQLPLMLVRIITQNLPLVVSAGLALLRSLVDGLLAALPGFLRQATELVPAFIRQVAAQSNRLIEEGSKIIERLIRGLSDNMPAVLAFARKVIPELAEAVISRIPVMIDAARRIVTALLRTMEQRQPELMAFAGEMIVKLAIAIVRNLPKVVVAGVKLIGAVLIGLLRALPRILIFAALLPGRIALAIGRRAGRALYGVGRDLITGFIRGIASMAKSVAKAAADVVGGAVRAAKSALRIKSPSRVFMEIGVFTAKGFAVGMKSGSAEVKRAVTDLVKHASSPSLVKGLTGTADQIADTIKKTVEMIRKAVKPGRGRDALIGITKATGAALRTEAKKLQQIRDRIKEARDFMARLRDSAIDTASVAGVDMEGKGVTAITDHMKKSLADMRQFAKAIKDLEAKGLNKTKLRELLEMGPEKGLAAATALSGASKATIKEINQLQADIDKTAGRLGKDGANMLYDSGSQAGKGFLSGLRAQEQAIIDWMAKLAAKLQKALKKALKIKSPSRVMADIGSQTTQGLTAGILSELRRLDRAADALMRPLDATATGRVPDAISHSVSRVSAREDRVVVELDVQGGEDEMVRMLRKILAVRGGGLGGVR
jgi:TP901 family phage tail tape measure protein